MSPEWPWIGLVGGIILPALGHAYHFMLAVNVSSGLGFREVTNSRIRLVLLAILIASSAILLRAHLTAAWWTWSWPLRGYPLLCVVSGGLILPITSLALELRRQPSEVSGRAELLDFASLDGADALIGPGPGAWLLRLPGNESLRLRRREWTVRYPELPEGLEQLTIVQISDLHFAPCYDRRYFERVAEACRDWSADIVVITGDLVDDDSVLSWIEPLLGPLHARLGKFAILGNHDAECHPQGILDALDRAGYESLEGRWTTVSSNGNLIALGGNSAPWGPSPFKFSIPDADFRLLLSHSPDQFYRARSWGIDLMLCGHNHGGQIRLPVFGPLLMPSVYSRRFDRGFFKSGPTLMYVNEGVGGMHPVRLGCPPEIARIVLTRRV